MLVLVELIISWMLVCLIWLVQLVHYPSFHFIADNQFSAFHQHHTTSITIIVMPLMLAELGLALWRWQADMSSWITIASLLLVAGIWASTFLVQVPLHNKLGTLGPDNHTIVRLISTNWWRTLLWTLKGVLLLFAWIKYS